MENAKLETDKVENQHYAAALAHIENLVLDSDKMSTTILVSFSTRTFIASKLRAYGMSSVVVNVMNDEQASIHLSWTPQVREQLCASARRRHFHSHVMEAARKGSRVFDMTSGAESLFLTDTDKQGILAAGFTLTESRTYRISYQ